MGQRFDDHDLGILGEENMVHLVPVATGRPAPPKTAPRPQILSLEVVLFRVGNLGVSLRMSPR
jgi:hypothetical protein